MNVIEQLKTQNTGRFVLIAAGAVVADLLAGWAIAPVLLAFVILATVPIVGLLAHIAALSFEWTKLGVTEEYSKAASRVMQQQMQASFRDSLDPIGQEALDEVERAVKRREEDAQSDA